MIFERTENLSLVRGILTEPSIWPHIGDDFAPDPKDWRPNDDPRLWYVLAIGGGSIAGLFLFVPESPVCWQAHAAMLPEARGKIAHEAGRQIVPWIWQHTTCQRITAQVPVTNRAAILYGMRSMGLKKYGVNERSFLKNYELRDQVLLGIPRD